MPQLYMIGGPNGAGKTTSALDLLPSLLHCQEYVNADSIAAALSPFAPESTAIQAGRLMLERIKHLATQQRDFSFETTMASRTFVPFLQECRRTGYEVTLLFLWLQSPTLAVERVQDRVRNGGHNIPENIVLRRYHRSISNFLHLYIPLADRWSLYDNSFDHPTIIAENTANNSIDVANGPLWKKFGEHANAQG